MSRGCGLVLIAILGSGIGCGGSAPPAKIDPIRDRLSKVVQTYIHASNDLKRPPKTEAELKTVAQQRGFADDIWVSPNDNQPFVIVWGVDIKKPGATTPILAHEKTGKDGKIWAINMMLVSEPMTEDELKKAIARGP